VKGHSAFRLRQLLRLEKAQVKYANWNPPKPITFLTCVTVFFLCTRLLMDVFKDEAIDWEEVILTFAGVDRHASATQQKCPSVRGLEKTYDPNVPASVHQYAS